MAISQKSKGKGQKKSAIPNPQSRIRVAALAGGVGGAKLAHGLAQILPPEQLTIIVNTGDDFEHLGLTICPDVDTVLYNLAGVNNSKFGWGRADETFHVLTETKRLGHDAWFLLGDKDIALHLLRRQMLDAGMSLTGVIWSWPGVWAWRTGCCPCRISRCAP